MKYPEDYINKIICGDCLEVMKGIPTGDVDIIITSPPYNFDAGSNLTGNKYKGQSDEMTQEQYLTFLDERLKEMLRISRYIFFNIQFISGNKQSLMLLLGKYADKVKEIIIWDKKTSEPAMEPNVLNSEFEFIIVFSNELGRKFQVANFDRGTQANVFRIPKNRGKFAISHNACFPDTLPLFIIQKFAKDGAIILDPFLGSGTTTAASKELGMNFIGIDVNQKYCEIAQRRLAQEYLFNV